MFNMISIEGIDKAGKGIVFKYIQELGKHQHVLLDRGPLSNYVFSKMFHRDFTYDIESFKNILFVFLDIAYDDWLIRCKMTNEKAILFDGHYQAYIDGIVDFEEKECTFLRYNTSMMTPYQIAKDVLKKFDELNA